jgi:hypothetical protein
MTTLDLFEEFVSNIFIINFLTGGGGGLLMLTPNCGASEIHSEITGIVNRIANSYKQYAL